MNLEFITWDFTKVKMKTYTWNLSVALLSPTCYLFNVLQIRTLGMDFQKCFQNLTKQFLVLANPDFNNNFCPSLFLGSVVPLYMVSCVFQSSFLVCDHPRVSGPQGLERGVPLGFLAF